MPYLIRAGAGIINGRISHHDFFTIAGAADDETQIFTWTSEPFGDEWGYVQLEPVAAATWLRYLFGGHLGEAGCFAICVVFVYFVDFEVDHWWVGGGGGWFAVAGAFDVDEDGGVVDRVAGDCFGELEVEDVVVTPGVS